MCSLKENFGLRREGGCMKIASKNFVMILSAGRAHITFSSAFDSRQGGRKGICGCGDHSRRRDYLIIRFWDCL